MKIVIGIDPGQTGAVALLEDGKPQGLFNMPTMDRKTSGHEINGAELAAIFRGIQMRYGITPSGGAPTELLVALELVNAMPSYGKGEERRQMGSSSSFRFGESYGIIKGVLASLSLGFRTAPPRTWKKYHGLIGAEKDAARTLMIQRFPNWSDQLARKKDVGRADALLIALWANDNL